MYADHFTLNVEEGDRLILCSDGMSGMVPDGEIERVAQQSSTAQICTDNLVDAALAAGGGDNVTVVVVDITDDGRVREVARKHKRTLFFAIVGLLIALVIADGGLVHLHPQVRLPGREGRCRRHLHRHSRLAPRTQAQLARG